MIRILFFLLAVCFLVFASLSAEAGNLSFSDGQGAWQSTRCFPPKAQEDMPKDPETAANDLNARMGAQSQYKAALENYMNCVKKEAESDAAAAGQVIIRAAQDIIQKSHAELMKMSASGAEQ